MTTENKEQKQAPTEADSQGHCALASGSTTDNTQAAEAKLREQVWRNEKTAERFCDNAPEVKMVLAELTKLRELLSHIQHHTSCTSLQFELIEEALSSNAPVRHDPSKS